MTTTPQEIERALLDVRKAYRLLHDYQRAALDAAQYIGNQLGFDYVGGWPLLSNASPRAGKGDFSNWSWDWLNMVFYDFHFTGLVKGKKIYLSIWLFSDTGYFMSKDENALPMDVATFAPVEQSGTKVGFIIYEEWKDEFDQLRLNRDAVRQFLEHDELLASHKAAGAFGMCCDFSRLSGQESADAVIGQLIERARSHGFALERANKAV